MPNDALRRAIVPGATDEPRTFPALLQKSIGQIAAALPKHMSAERLARIALTNYRQNAQLAECDPLSVLACVIQSAQLGLEPGLNGRAYLIPYKQTCTFIPGWKGMVELANRTGRSSCWTGAVFDGDAFDYALGDSPYIRHRPNGEDNPEKMIATYAVGRVRGSQWPIIEVWPVARLRRHRDRYNKVGRRHYSFDNWEMYARKVPLLQVLKYLPSSPELEAAMALSNDAEQGVQKVTMDDVLTGTYQPVTGDDAGSGAPDLDVEKLIAQMQSRKDIDTLDADASLIESVADERQKVGLRSLYSTLRAALEK